MKKNIKIILCLFIFIILAIFCYFIVDKVVIGSDSDIFNVSSFKKKDSVASIFVEYRVYGNTYEKDGIITADAVSDDKTTIYFVPKGSNKYTCYVKTIDINNKEEMSGFIIDKDNAKNLLNEEISKHSNFIQSPSSYTLKYYYNSKEVDSLDKLIEKLF